MNSYKLKSIAGSHTLLYFCRLMENDLIECCESRGVFSLLEAWARPGVGNLSSRKNQKLQFTKFRNF